MAWVLVATVLFASVLPCPGPAAPAATPAGATGHVHGAEDDAAHAPSLRAPCHCGCESAPRTDASLARLPLALLPASPASASSALAPLPESHRAELPDSPAPAVEHVPRPALA